METAAFDRANWFCTHLVIVRHGQSDNNTTYELIRNKFGDSLTPEQFEIELHKIHEPDCQISAIGARQSQCLADYIAAGKFTTLKQCRSWKVVSSPMKRCLMTTQIIASGFGQQYPVTVHPRFYEADGCFKKDEEGNSVGMPGYTQNEVESLFPGFTCLPGMENGWYAGHSSKETGGEFKQRVEELVQYLWTMHSDRLQRAQSKQSQPGDTAETNSKPPMPLLDDRDEGMFLVAHGNLIRAVISRLLNTYSMFTVDNTGLTYIQLWSTVDGENRMASVQYANRVDHLLSVDNGALIGGGDVFDDHWIQEFLIPDHV